MKHPNYFLFPVRGCVLINAYADFEKSIMKHRETMRESYNRAFPSNRLIHSFLDSSRIKMKTC